jgi:tRNA threonylcarbamoyladenosine biosynthesis protein TsaB
VIILALDTTSEFGSLALRLDGQTMAQLPVHSPDGFAHVIFQAIEQLLETNRISLQQIDCFAAAAGPGSFTGVRVGLTAAKGLAEAEGKSAFAVSNLRAMSSFGNLARRAVILDARRSEVFAGVYSRDLEPILPETVMPLTAWLDVLQIPIDEFISFPDSPFPAILRETRFAGLPFTEAPRSLAAAVALCAEIDSRSGKWLDPGLVDANYVRRSDAELFWKEA